MASTPRPRASERRVGLKRATHARGWISGRLGSHEGPNVSARAMDRARRARAGMPRFSSPVRTFLQRRQLEFAQQLDLVLEADAVLLVRTTPRLGHQGDRVRGRGTVGVLDEVRVLRGDLGTADAMALETARFEHPARAQLMLGVLENAPEGPPVRRLRILAAGVQLPHLGLDLLRRPRPKPELGAEQIGRAHV